MEAFGEATVQSLQKQKAGITEHDVIADKCTDIKAHKVVSVISR